MDTKSFSLQQIAECIQGEVVGNEDRIVDGIAPIQSAESSQITFYVDRAYSDSLKHSKAPVILHKDALPLCQTDAIVCDLPYLAYAQVAQLFNPIHRKKAGIDRSAVIAKTARIASNCYIGPNVVIGEHVSIGENSIIHAGCIIGDQCGIGSNCQLMANVTVYHNCHLSNRVLIHSGTVIGSDGFGHALDNTGTWVSIPQLGRVLLHDDVEIGANCSLDRGSLTDTVIEKGVIIDNLVQIAHNVTIGEHTAIAGCVGVSGSVTIGKRCRIGGQVGIVGHLSIADDVTLLAKAQVTKTIKQPGTYSSIIGCQERTQWNKNSVRLHHLDRIIKKLLRLEASNANGHQ
jgi:UDP-3-O-[3-hydroxymyristoyl] glucosamine N-acyltransferase